MTMSMVSTQHHPRRQSARESYHKVLLLLLLHRPEPIGHLEVAAGGRSDRLDGLALGDLHEAQAVAVGQHVEEACVCGTRGRGFLPHAWLCVP